MSASSSSLHRIEMGDPPGQSPPSLLLDDDRLPNQEIPRLRDVLVGMEDKEHALLEDEAATRGQVPWGHRPKAHAVAAAPHVRWHRVLAVASCADHPIDLGHGPSFRLARSAMLHPPQHRLDKQVVLLSHDVSRPTEHDRATDLGELTGDGGRDLSQQDVTPFQPSIGGGVDSKIVL